MSRRAFHETGAKRWTEPWLRGAEYEMQLDPFFNSFAEWGLDGDTTDATFA